MTISIESSKRWKDLFKDSEKVWVDFYHCGELNGNHVKLRIETIDHSYDSSDYEIHDEIIGPAPNADEMAAYLREIFKKKQSESYSNE